MNRTEFAMGKKNKKEKKGQGKEKTQQKAEKNAKKRVKKELAEIGEVNIFKLFCLSFGGCGAFRVAHVHNYVCQKIL